MSDFDQIIQVEGDIIYKVRNTEAEEQSLMKMKKIVTFQGHTEIAVAVEYSRKHEQEALKSACLKLKRAVPAAIMTCDTSEYVQMLEP